MRADKDGKPAALSPQEQIAQLQQQAGKLEEQLRTAQADLQKMRDTATLDMKQTQPSGTEKQQVGELKDQLLRAQAELQNVQRLAARDIEQAYLYSTKNLLVALLPGLDGLEHALSAFADKDAKGSAAVAPLAEGVKVTLDTLEAALKKAAKAVPIAALGEAFDPQKHLASGVREDTSASAAPGAQRVLEVLQRGWMLGERVLRPAMVIVSSPKTSPPSPSGPSGPSDQGNDTQSPTPQAANTTQHNRGKKTS